MKPVIIKTVCNHCGHMTPVKAFTQVELDQVVKDEKEACAVVCDRLLEKYLKEIGYDITQSNPDYYDVGVSDGIERCLSAIRAKGGKS